MATPEAPSERRRDLRVNWRAPVGCRRLSAGRDEPVEAETENLSAVGALLLVKAPVEPGELLLLDVTSSDPPLSLRRLARVMRIEGTLADGRRRIAVDFEPGSPHGRARLAAFLILVGARQGRRAGA